MIFYPLSRHDWRIKDARGLPVGASYYTEAAARRWATLKGLL